MLKLYNEIPSKRFVLLSTLKRIPYPATATMANPIATTNTNPDALSLLLIAELVLVVLATLALEL